jgi:hypothetical protein
MSNSFIGQSNLPLGLRNNNPGDFRTGIAWQGIVGQENGFLTFKDISYGLRALALDLINNINKGVNTIRTFISKYAPPSENDTASYIGFVADETGIPADEPLGTDNNTIHSLIRAILDKELGRPYSAMVSDSDIDQGIGMAGGLATFPEAVITALENPSVYIDNATPEQWGIVAGIGAGAILIIWLIAKK